MATATLQAESAPEQPSHFERLYAAHKRAKAAWDVAAYAPEYVGKDLPQEIDDELCERNADALDAFLLFPAENPRELLHKLRVYRDEEIWHGWHLGGQIVEQLVRDAHHVAGFGGK